MNIAFFPIDAISPEMIARFGGKTCALAALRQTGAHVPASLGLGVEAYQQFVKDTGVDVAIENLLARKRLEDMRWEEIWDLALNIRSLFLKAELPDFWTELGAEALGLLSSMESMAVRSSAPGEDTGATSFAGLHESHVGLPGGPGGTLALQGAIVRVWSSLWSDRALLYRRELGLDPMTSAMAVLVQECISGECSGVIFSADPTDATRCVIEAVPGMNQALVDGSTQPARWILDGKTGRVLEVQPGPWNLNRDRLPQSEEIGRVWELARTCEAHFGQAQDVEWTLRGSELYCLQSRPITTNLAQGTSWKGEDKRPWYLSLHRSFENLRALRREVEDELLPVLEQESAVLAGIDLGGLDDAALTKEILRRQTAMTHWRDIYWAKFIPLAHGVRLLGMVYNDALRPEDPFAFTDLLRNTDLEAVQRNNALEELAAKVRENPELRRSLEQGLEPADRDFQELFSRFLKGHGSLLCSTAWCTEGERGVVNLVLELATKPQPNPQSEGDGIRGSGRDQLERLFLEAFPESRREFAGQVLDLGRAAYKIRDNDNLALGRLQGELLRAVAEGWQRLGTRENLPDLQQTLDAVPVEYLDVASPTGRSAPNSQTDSSSTAESTTLSGQPAGPGLARGTARVIREPGELFAFQRGEILVCEAMDPGMSFVVPLAAAIVESRGGMLVHGAIIAREYGLPCVTGVTGATEYIRSGDLLLVDGFKGAVVFQK
ncbi:PEP/pyruvate-binding domain-containing protein [Desulfonatronum parangueonense]